MCLNGLELLAVALVAILVGWRNIKPLWVILSTAAIGGLS